MATHFHGRSFILGAIAAGVVLAITGLTQGWFTSGGTTRNNREAAGANKAVIGDGSLAPPPHSKGPAQTLQGRRAVKSKVRSLDEDALLEKNAEYQTSQRETKTEKARTATKSVAKPKLVAGAPTVKGTDRGPVATIPFSPTTTEPIGQVWIVAFLPQGADAKILDLSPTSGTTYSTVDKQLSENGWFAAFQGTPQDATNLSFHLAVSKPVTATVKGNAGIAPFEIDLKPPPK